MKNHPMNPSGPLPPHAPSGRLPLRVVFCRACGHDTGIPGAAYCDACRPDRLDDSLLTDIDRARM